MCQLCRSFDGEAHHCFACHGWHLDLWCDVCLDSWRAFAAHHRRAGLPSDKIRVLYELVARDEAGLDDPAAPLAFQLLLPFVEEPPASDDDIEAALRHRAAWSLAALLSPSMN